MVEMQANIARWVTEQKGCADSVTLKGQRTLETEKGTHPPRRTAAALPATTRLTSLLASLPCAENIEQLREKLALIAEQEAELQNKAAQERQAVDELRADLEKLTAQESRLPSENERLNQQLTSSRQLVVQREDGWATTVASRDAKLAELDKGCSLYAKRLGLAFERVGEERLRLTFTNIDE